MDSKDKAIADLRKQVQVLTAAVQPRETQINILRNQLTETESRLIGVDAIRNSLQAERELNLELNNRIGTLSGTIEAMKADNAHLKELNFSLQTELKNERQNKNSNAAGEFETANEKTA